jgi:hypothetical protein
MKKATVVLLSFFTLLPGCTWRRFSSLRQPNTQVSPETRLPHVQGSEVRALWLSFPFWDMSWENKQKFVSYIASKGVNKVFLSVYDSGIARWNSVALVKSGAALTYGDEPLVNAVNLFRSAGIEVSAFFEGGLSVQQNRDLYKTKPEAMQLCPNGGRASGEHGGSLYGFLDPSNTMAREILVSAFAELARHPIGFTEIQLDRFRYTHWKWKMCAAADGTSNPEHVNTLVRDIYQRIKLVRPEIFVTAAPVGSYGFWKHNQHWGQWVAGGYIDGIETQAYIPHEKLSECARGTPITSSRKITLAIFKGELASLTGNPAGLEAALSEMRDLGADVDKIMEVESRRPMVLQRQKEWAAAVKPVRLSIGFDAYRFDDSECVQEQVAYARSLGLNHGVLWVSQVSPDALGNPEPSISDNLEYLASTFWKK